MKFIRFPEATAAIKASSDVTIPFVIPDGTPEVAVTCVRLTEQDIHSIKRNNYRLFIIVPVVPPDNNRPAIITLIPHNPFFKKTDGKEQED